MSDRLTYFIILLLQSNENDHVSGNGRTCRTGREDSLGKTWFNMEGKRFLRDQETDVDNSGLQMRQHTLWLVRERRHRGWKKTTTVNESCSSTSSSSSNPFYSFFSPNRIDYECWPNLGQTKSNIASHRLVRCNALRYHSTLKTRSFEESQIVKGLFGIVIVMKRIADIVLICYFRRSNHDQLAWMLQ